jgi:hypothetical protein
MAESACSLLHVDGVTRLLSLVGIKRVARGACYQVGMLGMGSLTLFQCVIIQAPRYSTHKHLEARRIAHALIAIISCKHQGGRQRSVQGPQWSQRHQLSKERIQLYHIK